MKWKTTAPAGIPNGSQQPGKKCEEAAVKPSRHNQAFGNGAVAWGGMSTSRDQLPCSSTPGTMKDIPNFSQATRILIQHLPHHTPGTLPPCRCSREAVRMRPALCL